MSLPMPSLTHQGVRGWLLAAFVERSLALISAWLLSGAAFLALVFAVRWPMVHDSAILNYIGWRIIEGDVPYKSLFDMNMPGTYVFHALIAVTPGSWDARTGAFHAALVVICAGLCGFWTTRISGRRLVGMTAAAIAALGCIFLGPDDAIQRDLLLTAPALVGLIVASGSTHPSARRLAIAGLCFGLATTVKPQALLFVGCYVLAVALHRNPSATGWRRLGARVGVLGLGVAAAWVPFIVWLAVSGGLEEFLQVILPFDAGVYVQIGTPEGVFSVFRSFVVPELLTFTSHSVLRLIAIAATLHYALFDRSDLDRLTAGLAVTGGVAMYFLQHKGWPYHLYPSLVLMSVPLALLLFEPPAQGVNDRSQFVLRLIAWYALAALASVAVHTAVLNSTAYDPKAARTLAIVTTLRPLIQNGRTLQIFDTAEGGADVLLRLGMPLPTTMLYDYPLFLDRLGARFDREPIPQLKARFLAELKAARPDYLLIFESGWPHGGFERLDWFAPLGQWIRGDYRLLSEEKGYRLMARQDITSNQ